MGALETLLNYKAQKEAQKNADINAIPQAIAQFQAGRQQASDNLIKSLTLQATLAKSGLRLGPGNQLISDPSLGNNLDNQLKQQKIATYSAKENLYNKMMKDEDGGGSDPNSILEKASKSSGFDKEDFIVNPITRMVAGVPHTAYVPELKKPLPASARTIIDQMNPVRLGLDQNLDFLSKHPSIEKYMSPSDIRSHKGSSWSGGLGNLLLKLDPNKDPQDFAVFKAESDKIFQKFRKETTGAQAAMAELGWLAPDFPETSDNPKLYKSKAVEALKRIDEGYGLLLDNYSAQGYRTSDVRKAIVGKSKNINATEGKTSSGNTFKRI